MPAISIVRFDLSCFISLLGWQPYHNSTTSGLAWQGDVGEDAGQSRRDPGQHRPVLGAAPVQGRGLRAVSFQVEDEGALVVPLGADAPVAGSGSAWGGDGRDPVNPASARGVQSIPTNSKC